MKKLTSTILLLVTSHWSLVPSPLFAQSPLTLQTCYDLALKQSETVQIEEQNIQAARAKFTQTLGGILPKISFKGSEFLQDDSSTGDGGSGVGGTLTRFSKPELKFNAKQPLFQGLRELHALKATKAQKRESQALFENAKRLFFWDVTQAFYTTVQLEREVSISKEIEKTLEKRIRELKARKEIGKSRESELVHTEAELALQKASLNEIEGAYAVAKETLSFLTGVESDALADDSSIPKEPPALALLEEKVSKRPDVQAAEENWHYSKAIVSAEKGLRWPSINAEANYYTHRVGFQENIKWDALFSLDVPIFQGGSTRGKIQEAKVHSKQSELRLSEKRRQAITELKQAYQDFISSRKQTQAFQTARTKAEQNYRLKEEEYKLGLVNNLEVLTALKSLQEIKSSLNQALAQAKMNHFNLKVVSGEPIP